MLYSIDLPLLFFKLFYLSSFTRDQTWVLGRELMESQVLARQGIPDLQPFKYLSREFSGLHADTEQMYTIWLRMKVL